MLRGRRAYKPFYHAPNTHPRKRTRMHILSRAMKTQPAVTCWSIRGWYIKIPPSNANTCKADTFHKSPEEAGLVCVCISVCVCAPESSSLILLQEVTSIYLSYIVTSPNTRTQLLQCSAASSHCHSFQLCRQCQLKTRGTEPTLQQKRRS